MNGLTLEWIEKAEAGFAAAGREAAVTQDPNPDATCFHAQQCVEKYLKATRQEAGLPVPRTHDLPALLALVLPLAPSRHSLESDFIYLTSFAVEYRYPGYRAAADDAARAVAVAGAFRSAARAGFGLP